MGLTDGQQNLLLISAAVIVGITVGCCIAMLVFRPSAGEKTRTRMFTLMTPVVALWIVGSGVYAYYSKAPIERLQLSVENDNAVSIDVNDNAVPFVSKEMIALGEDRYWTQNGFERQEKGQSSGKDINVVFANFEANFPCFWGEEIAGVIGRADGNKWVCGISYITEPCVVYSLGSNNQFGFESGILSLAPQCEVHVFDPFVDGSDKPIYKNANMHYHKWGISSANNETGHMFTLPTIMSKLDHSYIDILKIDVEGSEWSSFFAIDQQWPSIGQMQIEIHLRGDHLTELKSIFGLFEKHGLRLFHKEINVFQPHACIEYAFIQRDWHPQSKSYSN